MRFQIHRSINNIYTALSLDDGRLYTCRLKGKTLKTEKREYNPVAVGDIAQGEPYSENEALITRIEERKSTFTRWNEKSQMNQIIAANQDLTAIILSSFSPPFHPRFVDRAIASTSSCEILLVMNKSDYPLTQEEQIRWELYEELGYTLLRVSSKTGDNLDKLKEILKGKTTAFVGQSGVGKSSLINSITGSNQRTGEISDKYNRGKHTTNHSIFLKFEDFSLIDTPGVREISIPLEDASMVRDSFPELRKLECQYPGCLHRGEKGCVVPSLIEKGIINEDRYTSYIRMLESLDERRPFYMRTRNGRKNN